MANKNDKDDRIVSIDDDYIELLESVREKTEYEDIYSNSSDDIYISKNSDIFEYESDDESEEDDGAVYIRRQSQNRRKNIEFIDISSKSPTQETPTVKGPPPIKKPVKKSERIDEDEVSDFDARHKNSRKNFVKPIVALFVIFLAVVVGFIGIISITASGITSKFKDAEKIEHIDDVNSLKTASYVKNILLIGTDKKTGDSSRSDSIMIVSVNSKTGKITIVSVLRDTHVYIPGECEAKINSAYSWGGANLLIQTLEYNFGIKIDDYATVDFDMFQALVDGVGGVYVDVTEAEAEHLNDYFKLGTEGKPEKVVSGENVYLDGYHALCYARIRKLDSDFNRTERQRKIIKAIAENVKSDLTPTGVFNLMKTAESVAPYIETTLSQGDFWSLVATLGSAYAKANGELDSLLINEKIPFDDTWWYSSEWDGSSISIDLEANKTILHEKLYAESVEDLLESTDENQ